jgi:ferredoxin
MYYKINLVRRGEIIIRKKEKKMNVIVEDSCIACGACESICDAVFSIEDKAVVNAGAVEANADAVKEAAEACPVSAIIVE